MRERRPSTKNEMDAIRGATPRKENTAQTIRCVLLCVALRTRQKWAWFAGTPAMCGLDIDIKYRILLEGYARWRYNPNERQISLYNPNKH